MDEDILDPVQRRMRAQADLLWLQRNARSHRQYADFATRDDLRASHTKDAEGYEAAMQRAIVIFKQLLIETSPQHDADQLLDIVLRLSQ